ncbi:MAG: hypothetical protein ACLUOI_30095 [Eisenbergiella sp.]
MKGGTIVGKSRGYLAGPDEVVEFNHTAYSKAVFGKAGGSSQFLAGKRAGMYDGDVIG